MSSVHYLREYIGERLTAAAAEIFTEFEKTILRYEEEIDRQRRLLDLCWKPELRLHRVEQEPVHEPQFLTDQQEELLEHHPWIKEEQDEAEPVEIKAEEEELCAGEEEDHLVTTVPEDYSEPEPDRDQLTCSSPAGPRDQDQDSGSNENEESPKKPERTDAYHGYHGNEADQTETSDSLFSCKTCEETLSQNSVLIRHVKVQKVLSPTWIRPQYRRPTCVKPALPLLNQTSV